MSQRFGITVLCWGKRPNLRVDGDEASIGVDISRPVGTTIMIFEKTQRRVRKRDVERRLGCLEKLTDKHTCGVGVKAQLITESRRFQFGALQIFVGL